MAMFGGSKRAEKLESAATQASSAQQTLKLLRERLEHQTQLTRAVWELVKAKLDYTDEDLRVRVQKLEEESAAQPKAAATCASCGRPIQENIRICIYCGADHDEQPLF